jgi:DNA-binding GntR family transcriptional regulator
MSPAKLQALDRVRLVDRIIEQLRDMILDGSLPPGTRLVQEKLAADLAVSRTPLREALRVLEQDGLVSLSASSSAAVVIELDEHDVRELYEVREVLDGLAARLAAEAGHPPEAFKALDRCVEIILSASDPFDTRRFVKAHTEFHVGIVHLARNRRLTQLIPMIRMSSQMLYPSLRRQPDRMLESAHEHATILEAIRSGDGGESERLARAHIRAAMVSWMSSPEPGKV